ncbi:unnamed protein product, partial [Polarella glacialis]
MGAAGSTEQFGRKNAAARLALRRALVDEPAHFAKFFDDAVTLAIRDFISSSAASSKALPEDGEDVHVPVRTYIERRAKLRSHKPTIWWMWSIAGIYECLSSGDVPQARARTALLLVSEEQLALDSGGSLLAQELLMEELRMGFSLSRELAIFAGQRFAWDTERSSTSGPSDGDDFRA